MIDFSQSGDNIILTAFLENGTTYKIINKTDGSLTAEYIGTSREDNLLDTYLDTLVISQRFEDYDSKLVMYDYKTQKQLLSLENTAILDAQIEKDGKRLFAVVVDMKTQEMRLIINSIWLKYNGIYEIYKYTEYGVLINNILKIICKF